MKPVNPGNGKYSEKKITLLYTVGNLSRILTPRCFTFTRSMHMTEPQRVRGGTQSSKQISLLLINIAVWHFVSWYKINSFAIITHNQTCNTKLFLWMTHPKNSCCQRLSLSALPPWGKTYEEESEQFKVNFICFIWRLCRIISICSYLPEAQELLSN